MEDLKQFEELLHQGECDAILFEIPGIYISRCVAESVMHAVQEIGDELENTLLKRSPEQSQQHNVKQAIAKFRTKHVESLKKLFSLLEKSMSTVINFPPNVELPHFGHVKRYADGDLEKIDAQIDKLNARRRRALCMKSMLKNEKIALTDIQLMEKKVVELRSVIDQWMTFLTGNKKLFKSWNLLMTELESMVEILNDFIPVKMLDDANHYLGEDELNWDDCEISNEQVSQSKP